MSTTPRLPSAVAGRPADFATIMAHRPDLGEGFWNLYGEVMARGVVDQVLKETVRLRNARVTGCGFCRNVRYSMAREDGLTEDRAMMIDDGYLDSELDDRQKLVLRYTDVFLTRPADLTPELAAEMSVAFTPEEIVEITMAAALYLGMAKPLIALGTEPEQMDVTVLPTPDPGLNLLAI